MAKQIRSSTKERKTKEGVLAAPLAISLPLLFAGRRRREEIEPGRLLQRGSESQSELSMMGDKKASSLTGPGVGPGQKHVIRDLRAAHTPRGLRVGGRALAWILGRARQDREKWAPEKRLVTRFGSRFRRISDGTSA